MAYNRTIRNLKEVSSSISGYISILWIAVSRNSIEKRNTLYLQNREILEKLHASENAELIRKYLVLIASAEEFYKELSAEIEKRSYE